SSTVRTTGAENAQVVFGHITERFDDFQNRLELVQGASRDVNVATEVAATGARGALGEVQRNAVGSPPPLRGERKSFLRWQAEDCGPRQHHEADRLLPCSEISKVP